MTIRPPAVEIVNENGTSPYVLTCEHASSFIPDAYGSLGLAPEHLQRHIAWDIGAAEVARLLSALLDAPLFLGGYSRLLIDCNRPVSSPTSIPLVSEETPIPGNTNLSSEMIRARQDEFYWPFQNSISAHLDFRQQAKQKTIVVGVHSFTPIFKKFVRPWHAGILFRQSTSFGNRLVAELQAPDLLITANEPYTIDDISDYTVPVHGENRGLDAVLIEIRQDLIATTEGAHTWANRLHKSLRSIQIAR